MCTSINVGSSIQFIFVTITFFIQSEKCSIMYRSISFKQNIKQTGCLKAFPFFSDLTFEKVKEVFFVA
jgi:hypothetical protein